uniref:Uncharacterized protein n=1 Tax=Avena sativa TaxID=4498 RepID=A0ACD5TQ80_AVESA
MSSWSHLKHPRQLYCRVANTFVPAIVTITTLTAAILIRGAISPIHLLLAILLGTATLYRALRPRTVYLVDYVCFTPSPNSRYPKATLLEHAHLSPWLDDSSVRFIDRVLQRSGMSEETHVPPLFLNVEPSCRLYEARAEAELVVFSMIDELLVKTCIDVLAIDILITNCTVFCPVPCITDSIMNRYKLRRDIRVINLSGMGCSAGVTAAGLARNMLRVMPRGSNALVVSTETTGPCYYWGNNHSMKLVNILFRMGGAAKLLSNSEAKARFRFEHVVRTIMAANNSAYRCVYQQEDEKGNLGTALSKDLMAIAGDTLKMNIAATARLVLPLSEIFKFFRFSVGKKVLYWKRMAPYIPNFHFAFEHFCIHVGGPAVIDSIQHGLNLSNKDVEPSRMTLHRFGNQSTASVWYQLAYIEAKGRLKEGNRVWMIGFGAGYECSTAGWVCIRPSSSVDGPWASCIHRYPVDVSKKN